jgi:hypothetical protein
MFPETVGFYSVVICFFRVSASCQASALCLGFQTRSFRRVHWSVGRCTVVFLNCEEPQADYFAKGGEDEKRVHSKSDSNPNTSHPNTTEACHTPNTCPWQSPDSKACMYHTSTSFQPIHSGPSSPQPPN